MLLNFLVFHRPVHVHFNDLHATYPGLTQLTTNAKLFIFIRRHAIEIFGIQFKVD